MIQTALARTGRIGWPDDYLRPEDPDRAEIIIYLKPRKSFFAPLNR
jgi:hypothetical protein